MIILLFATFSSSLLVEYGLSADVISKMFCHSSIVPEQPWASVLSSVIESQYYYDTGNLISLNPISFVTGLETYFNSNNVTLDLGFDVNNCLNTTGYIHPRCIAIYFNQTQPKLIYEKDNIESHLFIEKVYKVELNSLDDFISLMNVSRRTVYTGYNGKNDNTGIFTSARAILSLLVDDNGDVQYRYKNSECVLYMPIFYNKNTEEFGDKYDILKQMYAFVISEVDDSLHSTDDDSVSSSYKLVTIILGVLLGLFVCGFFVMMGLFMKKINVNKKGDDDVVRSASVEMTSTDINVDSNDNGNDGNDNGNV